MDYRSGNGNILNSCLCALHYVLCQGLWQALVQHQFRLRLGQPSSIIQLLADVLAK